MTFKTPTLTTQRLVTLAMLIGAGFVLHQLDQRITPQLQVTITFIVHAIIGAIGGPIWSFVTLAILDLVTIFVSPDAANFIPAWTLMEATTGSLYGLFFYGKSLQWQSKKDWLYVAGATFAIMLFSTFVMTPLLIQIYFKVPFLAQYASGRIFKIIEWPIRVLITMAVLPQLQRIPDIRKLMDLPR